MFPTLRSNSSKLTSLPMDLDPENLQPEDDSSEAETVVYEPLLPPLRDAEDPELPPQIYNAKDIAKYTRTRNSKSASWSSETVSGSDGHGNQKHSRTFRAMQEDGPAGNTHKRHVTTTVTTTFIRKRHLGEAPYLHARLARNAKKCIDENLVGFDDW